MGYKAAETTCNINHTFSPGTANECTVQWWFKKFCKGNESLEDEECSDWSSEVDNDQLRESSKLILLQLPEELPKNSASTILQSCGIWSKLERWKSSVSGCLMNWPQVKKIIILKCDFLLSYATTANHFSIGLWHAIKSGLYTTISDDQLSGWTEKEATKHFPKSNLHQNKGRGHCLVICCWSDPLQLSESQWNQSIRGECSANQGGALKTAMPATGIGRQKGPSFITW